MATEEKVQSSSSENSKKSSGFDSLLSKLDFSVDTKTGISNIATWVTVVMYLLFFHLFLLKLKLPDEQGSYLPYLFVAFVPQAVQLLLFGGDTIANSRNGRALYFQSQFPAAFISRTFSVPEGRGNFYWFTVFDSQVSDTQRTRTYKYGYTCRLVYYLYYISVCLLGISLLTIAFESLWFHWHWRVDGIDSIKAAFHLTSGPLLKAIYLAHLIVLAAYLRFGNRLRIVDAEGRKVSLFFSVFLFFRRERFRQLVKEGSVSFIPSGVWVRWMEINRRHHELISLHFTDLETLEKFVKSKTLKHEEKKIDSVKPNLRRPSGVDGSVS